PGDGVLACRYALALMKDNDWDEAARQLQKARSLKIDPAKVIGSGDVKRIDEHAARKREDARRQEEDRKRQAERDREFTNRQQDPFGLKPVTDEGSSILWKWIVRPLMWFTIIYLTTMALMCLGGLILARYTRGPRALDLLARPEEELVAAGGQVLRTIHES